MAIDNLKEKLAKVVSKEPSKWLADAQSRKANKGWLKHSQQVALQVLTRLDELKMSQVKLAEILSITPQQVNKWVKGNENFTFETIDKLEKALDFQLMQICTQKPQQILVHSTSINISLKPSHSVIRHSSYSKKKERAVNIIKANDISSFKRSRQINFC